MRRWTMTAAARKVVNESARDPVITQEALKPRLERTGMQRLGTFEDARQKVLADVQRCISAVRTLSSLPYESPEAGVSILHRLRKEIYEDLNQIQHEHFIVLAAQWLLAEGICPANTEWFWNPRQTGNHQEPDLRGVHEMAVLVSAEITTSESPMGFIDTRMGNTLAKLARTEGSKYYFVRTESMCRRARTKVAKAGWPIKVVPLTVEPNAV